jgi:hypothetical protein
VRATDLPRPRNSLVAYVTPPLATETGKLLAARRALRRSQWDGAYLDHFVQILSRVDTLRHGFALADIQAVETAWAEDAGDTWSGGFVVRLKDGRRAHADGRAGRSHWSDDSDIDAGLLDAGDLHPETGARHGWQRPAWDETLARGLNELLSRIGHEAMP